MKIEAFVYDENGNESVIAYNDIDIDTIVYDLQITFNDWDYAYIEWEGGCCLAFPNGNTTLEKENI